MRRERTQLNINIDPELLLSLKSEAIKRGMTLTQFVISKLSNIKSTSTSTLEQRLSKIEEHLQLNTIESVPPKETS